MTCDACGATVPAGARYCDACGTPLALPDRTDAAAADHVHELARPTVPLRLWPFGLARRSAIALVAVALLLVILGGVALARRTATERLWQGLPLPRGAEVMQEDFPLHDGSLRASYLIDRGGRSPEQVASALREQWLRAGLTLETTLVRGRLGGWSASVEYIWRRDGATISVVLVDDGPTTRLLIRAPSARTAPQPRPSPNYPAATSGPRWRGFPLPPEVASASATFASQPDEIGYLLAAPSGGAAGVYARLLNAMEREGYEVVWAALESTPVYRWQRPGEARQFQAQVLDFGRQVQFYVTDLAGSAAPRGIIAGTAARWGDLPLPPWSVQDVGLSAPSHGYFLIVAPGATAQEVRAWLVYSWQASGLRLTRTVAPSGEYPGFMTWESAPGSGRFIDVAVWPGAGVLLLDIMRR